MTLPSASIPQNVLPHFIRLGFVYKKIKPRERKIVKYNGIKETVVLLLCVGTVKSKRTCTVGIY